MADSDARARLLQRIEDLQAHAAVQSKAASSAAKRARKSPAQLAVAFSLDKPSEPPKGLPRDVQLVREQALIATEAHLLAELRAGAGQMKPSAAASLSAIEENQRRRDIDLGIVPLATRP